MMLRNVKGSGSVAVMEWVRRVDWKWMYHCRSVVDIQNRSLYSVPKTFTSFINNESMPIMCGRGRREDFHNLKPSTGEVLGTVLMASQDDVDHAVRCAQRAFEENQDRSRTYISQAFNEAAHLIENKYKEELAYLEALDSGIPIAQTKYHIEGVVECLRYYAGIASTGPNSGTTMDCGEKSSAFCYTRREPLGVVAGIGAWNYPLLLMMWKLAPALASGNSFIYKPSECTVITALKFAEILNKEVSLPAGLFNVLLGDSSVGKAIVGHNGIRKISFTGSTSSGTLIAQEAAKANLKKCSMELGGKSPLIIFADSNLDDAVNAAIGGNFVNNGEVCTNCTRVYVEKLIKDEFIEKLLNQTKELKVGDPLDEHTSLGPMMMPPMSPSSHIDKVSGYISRARNDSRCKLIYGGNIEGHFVFPTIFFCESDEVEIAQHEIFGPVMSIFEFENEQKVIERANSSDYGLAAGIMTTNLSRAHDVAKKLDAGYVWINNYNISPVEMTFGGRKLSGYGSMLGPDSINQYTQTKTVYVELGATDSPL